jgi:hypothetical protein
MCRCTAADAASGSMGLDIYLPQKSSNQWHDSLHAPLRLPIMVSPSGTPPKMLLTEPWVATDRSTLPTPGRLRSGTPVSTSAASSYLL